MSPLRVISGHSALELPLTKELIEMHGGELSIESRPNHGTLVKVQMPIERISH
ncbi:MAG: hypothetical protein VB913_04480 [Rhodospirillales bacterium]